MYNKNIKTIEQVWYAAIYAALEFSKITPARIKIIDIIYQWAIVYYMTRDENRWLKTSVKLSAHEPQAGARHHTEFPIICFFPCHLTYFSSDWHRELDLLFLYFWIEHYLNKKTVLGMLLTIKKFVMIKWAFDFLIWFRLFVKERISFRLVTI